MTRQLRRLLTAVCAVAMLPLWALAQQGGTITGRVIDRGTSQPIADAQVFIVGTQRGTRTGDDGQYRISGVTAGDVQVRVIRIGYQAATQSVTLAEGQTATANFTITATAVQLDQVVVTATGEQQRRRETGNSVGQINVDSLNLAPVTNFSEVLTGRTAGVTVMQAGGTSGTGSRVRIRGSNSVSLTNDPLLIIDGVRVNNSANSTTIGVGGQQPSRFNDINPEDIENIEIIKGPAAAALYGTAAANGVIQITTKRGRAGKTRWTTHMEAGTINEVTAYPANFFNEGTFLGVFGDPDAFGFNDLPRGQGVACSNELAVRNFCTQGEVVSFNPLEQVSPFRTGHRTSFGASVSGGSEVATYYIAGDLEKETGVYQANDLDRANLRANIRGQLRPNLDVTVTTGFLASDLRLPQNDNNVLGLVSGGLLGKAFDCSRQNPCGDTTGGDFSSADTLSRGYIVNPPERIQQINTRQDVRRFTSGINANWQPFGWLRAVGTFGLDFTNRWDNETIPPDQVLFAELPLGERTSNPYQLFTYTGNTGATATFALTPTVQSTTSAGVQYSAEEVRGTEAFGSRLQFGTSTLSGAATLFAVDEVNTRNVTIGAYAQEQVAWRDRVFLTGAIRGDQNSAFGENFGFITYPAVSASWVIGEEEFFPQTNWVSSLRLRTSYGESGQRPGIRDAIRFFTPVQVTINNTDLPGVTVGGIGNLNLKPERSGELEVGADLGILGDRLNLEVTYYNKTTRDALVLRRLPLSTGEAQSRFENLGEVRNTGFEALLNGTVFEVAPAKMDFSLSFSTNENKVINLGDNIQPIIFGLGGSSQRHQNDYPLGGYWGRTIVSFEDKNGDGIISRVGCPGAPRRVNPATGSSTGVPQPECEITLTDTSVFIGTPFPKRELTLNTGLTLFEYVKVSAQLDHRGGHKQYNATREFRCGSFQNCRDIQDPKTPLADQAKVAARLLGSRGAYIEDATFTKLRELSLTLTAPKDMAGRFGVAGASLTFAGRNLYTWTDYTGFDPEVNVSAQLNFNQADFLSQPPTRNFTTRLDINF